MDSEGRGMGGHRVATGNPLDRGYRGRLTGDGVVRGGREVV